MASPHNQQPKSLYPTVIETNPERDSAFSTSKPSPSLYPVVGSGPPLTAPSSSAKSMYPSFDMKDLVENLFPDEINEKGSSEAPTAPPEACEEVLVCVPGAVAHLIDGQHSIELACGVLSIVRLVQGPNVIAVFARIADDIQWPLAKDETAVKLDENHYFFTLRVPDSDEEVSTDPSDNIVSYGITFASKGQENLLKKLDGILGQYSCFSVQKVSKGSSEVLDSSVAKGLEPSEVVSSEEKKKLMEATSAAYWTTLAPNVEDYNGLLARTIAAGSGQLIKGILWCGDVTVDRLKWGNDFLKKRTEPNAKPAEVSRQAMRRMKRVKRMSKMSEKVASGVLSGVLKVSGFFTSSVVNSKAGKKFFSLLPGEIVLASLDGFDYIRKFQSWSATTPGSTFTDTNLDDFWLILGQPCASFHSFL
ncbi:protein EARLY-RESPONSIVE TO DEHYDRATION 7, chloroplastic isoform X2 [Amborella trichopoda]|uniref:protein EARLY-RESPONSIVE TO DEHYDRATION 7, chloroplastic isoform X2 n=1 Tax=Amborella trichopoda TaxID=13333 RepID=UPI0009C160D3|nr:protein EARLY-RESPONSIVE TO DEHYDRATION 7, chloroplastic isoform X2 [Amborella trichopoda]|eukprot:XP_020530719.1 protein EARLY-RESPONSIVE TO DEHYDRATION 7, chloroplastic isoform X2 [Amborella trichopoda]